MATCPPPPRRARSRRGILLLTLLGCIGRAGAQGLEIELVREFTPGQSSSSFDITAGKTRAGESIVYVATTEGTPGQRRLWRSDGTAVGTHRLGDAIVHTFLPMQDGGVYATATAPDTGLALYRSDGDAGLELVWDPVAGPADGVRSELLRLGSDVVVVPLDPSFPGLWSAGWTHAPSLVSSMSGVRRSIGSNDGIILGSSTAQPAWVFGAGAGTGRFLLPSPVDPPMGTSPPHVVGAAGPALCGKALVPDQPSGIVFCADAERQFFRRVIPSSTGVPLTVPDNVQFESTGSRLAFIRGPGQLWVSDGSHAGTYAVADDVGSQCFATDGAERLFYTWSHDLRMATITPGGARNLATMPSSYSVCEPKAATRWRSRSAIAVGGLVLTSGAANDTQAWWNFTDLPLQFSAPIAASRDWLYFAGTRSDVGTELFRVRWPDLLESGFEDE